MKAGRDSCSFFHLQVPLWRCPPPGGTGKHVLQRSVSCRFFFLSEQTRLWNRRDNWDRRDRRSALSGTGKPFPLPCAGGRPDADARSFGSRLRERWRLFCHRVPRIGRRSPRSVRGGIGCCGNGGVRKAVPCRSRCVMLRVRRTCFSGNTGGWNLWKAYWKSSRAPLKKKIWSRLLPEHHSLFASRYVRAILRRYTKRFSCGIRHKYENV